MDKRIIVTRPGVGYCVAKGVASSEHEAVQKALAKLYKYESTGLSPREIENMAEDYEKVKKAFDSFLHGKGNSSAE